MIELRIKRITDFSLLASFHCGVKMMDSFIHQYLELCSYNHYCESYAVLNASTHEVVALFALNFDSLILDSDDKDEI